MGRAADAECMGILVAAFFFVLFVLAPLYGVDSTEGRRKI